MSKERKPRKPSEIPQPDKDPEIKPDIGPEEPVPPEKEPEVTPEKEPSEPSLPSEIREPPK